MLLKHLDGLLHFGNLPQVLIIVLFDIGDVQLYTCPFVLAHYVVLLQDLQGQSELLKPHKHIAEILVHASQPIQTVELPEWVCLLLGLLQQVIAGLEKPLGLIEVVFINVEVNCLLLQHCDHSHMGGTKVLSHDLLALLKAFNRLVPFPPLSQYSPLVQVNLAKLPVILSLLLNQNLFSNLQINPRLVVLAPEVLQRRQIVLAPRQLQIRHLLLRETAEYQQGTL